MQGRKDIQPKMMYHVSLDTPVPADNFYRKLAQTLDLHFLYKATSKYELAYKAFYEVVF
jgi:hypothetical protein